MDEADRLGGDAAADQREQLLSDELERTARAGALEEPDGAVDRLRLAVLVGEQAPLQVREGRMCELAIAGRQLLDRAAGEPGEVLGCALQRCERRPAGLVREGHGHLGPGGERLQQRPLGPGQVLEAVREHRRALPGGEVGLEPLGGAAAQQVAVPVPEPVELVPVGAVERGEIAVELPGVEQPRLELAERLLERLGEAAEARRRGEAVERGPGDHAPDEQRPLRGGEERARLRAAVCDLLEEVVERADARRRAAPGASRAARARRARRPTGSAR